MCQDTEDRLVYMKIYHQPPFSSNEQLTKQRLLGKIAIKLMHVCVRVVHVS